MMNSPLISIIIPVYNIEAYLSECVDSVLCQGYTNFEILLIDDGSTDGSEELCDRYSELDNRIITFHKVNGGLSDARNYGMRYMKGELFIFIDGDDLISKDFLEKMVEEYKKSKSDIVTCRYDRLLSGDIYETTLNYSGKISVETLLRYCFKGYVLHSACGKLFIKEISEILTFPVGRYYEDEFTIYDLLIEYHTAIANEASYIYRKRTDSITQSNKLEKRSNDLFDAMEHVIEIINNKCIGMRYLIDYKILQDSLEILKNSIKSQSNLLIRECRNKINTINKSNLERMEISKSYLVQYFLIKYCFPLYKFIFFMMYKLKIIFIGFILHELWEL